MRKIALFFAFLTCLGFSTEAKADTWVNGYFRSDGTFVPGHYRSDRNDTETDNWSVYPNYNPYTLERGTNRTDENEIQTIYSRPSYDYRVLNGNVYRCTQYSCVPVYPVY